MYFQYFLVVLFCTSNWNIASSEHYGINDGVDNEPLPAGLRPISRPSDCSPNAAQVIINNLHSSNMFTISMKKLDTLYLTEVRNMLSAGGYMDDTEHFFNNLKQNQISTISKDYEQEIYVCDIMNKVDDNKYLLIIGHRILHPHQEIPNKCLSAISEDHGINAGFSPRSRPMPRNHRVDNEILSARHHRISRPSACSPYSTQVIINNLQSSIMFTISIENLKTLNLTEVRKMFTAEGYMDDTMHFFNNLKQNQISTISKDYEQEIYVCDVMNKVNDNKYLLILGHIILHPHQEIANRFLYGIIFDKNGEFKVSDEINHRIAVLADDYLPTVQTIGKVQEMVNTFSSTTESPENEKSFITSASTKRSVNSGVMRGSSSANGMLSNTRDSEQKRESEPIKSRILNEKNRTALDTPKTSPPNFLEKISAVLRTPLDFLFGVESHPANETFLIAEDSKEERESSLNTSKILNIKKRVTLDTSKINASSWFVKNVFLIMSGRGGTSIVGANLIKFLNIYGWYFPVDYVVGRAISKSTVSNKTTNEEASYVTMSNGYGIKSNITSTEENSANTRNKIFNENSKDLLTSFGARGASNIEDFQQNIGNNENWIVLRYNKLIPSLRLLHDNYPYQFGQIQRLFFNMYTTNDLKQLQTFINYKNYAMELASFSESETDNVD